MSSIYTILGQIPDYVKDEIARLHNKHRLVRSFTVTDWDELGLTPSGHKTGNLRIVLTGFNQSDQVVVGSRRSTIHSQLIQAGVAIPDFTPEQEQAWKKLKQFLSIYYPVFTVEASLFNINRNAHLLGLLDRINLSSANTQYIQCRELINQLGADIFAIDFEWYFGKPVGEDSHLWDE